jgi:hypothetical protein
MYAMEVLWTGRILNVRKFGDVTPLRISSNDNAFSAQWIQYRPDEYNIVTEGLQRFSFKLRDWRRC